MTFLKKMFELTKMTADPKAQDKPRKLEPETSNVHTSITPTVRGRREM